MSTIRPNTRTATARLGPVDSRPHADGTHPLTEPNVLRQIEACIPALRRYAVGLLDTRAAADDLVRDCLARAVGRLPVRRDATNVRAWLFASMHGLFLSRMRSDRFHTPSKVLDPTVGGGASRQCRPEVDGPAWRDLLRGLKRLPEEQRSAVLLVSVEDLTYPDAATVLGVRARTMMSHLARGRERLRRFTITDDGPALRRVKWAVMPGA
jgi:RNA polymerase sigma factor (sigma-70 family)